MEKNGIWEETWKVAAFMVDTRHRIKLKSIADILQELANNHANHRQCGFKDMKASGKFWVLNRQVIEIKEWPIWEQTIRVESWISMMKGPFSLRHFAVYDHQENIMVIASYLWTSIDKLKMKPVATLIGDIPIIEKRTFDLPQPTKIKIDGKVLSKYQYRIQESDLDILGHTNNAIYLEWASNILASYDSVDFRRIEANYVGESFADQEVSIQLLKMEESTYAVEVLNAEKEYIFKLKVYD